MNCEQKALKYIKKLTGRRVDTHDIPTTLDEIMTYIYNNILHHQYNSINDAIKLIPVHARYLIKFIQLFSMYIDYCKNDNNYTKIKIFMCDNKCNLCKIYHIMASWGLFMIECLYINTRKGDRTNQLLHLSMNRENTIKNYVLYNNETLLQLNDIVNCIKNTNKDKTLLKESYFLISSALYLREQFQYFCDKPIDRKHTIFNKTLDRLKTQLLQKIKTP
jgi:hypothetical protein